MASVKVPGCPTAPRGPGNSVRVIIQDVPRGNQVASQRTILLNRDTRIRTSSPNQLTTSWPSAVRQNHLPWAGDLPLSLTLQTRHKFRGVSGRSARKDVFAPIHHRFDWVPLGFAFLAFFLCFQQVSGFVLAFAVSFFLSSSPAFSPASRLPGPSSRVLPRTERLTASAKISLPIPIRILYHTTPDLSRKFVGS
jgi:hypothetical protein